MIEAYAVILIAILGVIMGIGLTGLANWVSAAKRSRAELIRKMCPTCKLLFAKHRMYIHDDIGTE